LAHNGIAIGRNKLFKTFRDDGWLISWKGDRFNDPTEKGLKSGYFKSILKERLVNGHPVKDRFGTSLTDRVTLITPKGQLFFLGFFKKRSTGMVSLFKNLLKTEKKCSKT
jgi:phage antirepressor YoqD-like protein